MFSSVLARRLRPPMRHAHAHAPCAKQPASRRSFLSFPAADAQNLEATRTLPYGREALYSLIADVDSYSLFVPYCSHSRVTQWSQLDSNGRRWPTVADLHVGWAGFNEEFTSRLRCVPGVSVEAVNNSFNESSPNSAPVFKKLMTRWSLKPISLPPSPSTEVHFAIEYQFANPLYAAVSAAVSDKVANIMIEAFEDQARKRLGSSSDEMDKH